MNEGLARVIALALEEACALNEERIRVLIREEVERLRPAGTTAGWQTPPAAARTCNCSVRRVRLLVKQGRVETRLRNLAANPKAPKYEVLVASVEAALRGDAPKQPVVDASSWASARAARRGA